VPNEPESVRLARVEERLSAIGQRVEHAIRQIETFGPLGGQMIEAAADLRSLAEDITDMRRELDREREAADREHDRLRAQIEKGAAEREKLRAEIAASQQAALNARTQRQAMSMPLKVALITGCFGLVGTLIIVLTHSGA
jgi:chromosome segregation ATPase